MITYYGIAGPQSTLYGIFHKNIASKLDDQNWKTKATCRVHRNGILYITVDEGERSEGGKVLGVHYRVNAAIAYDRVYNTEKALFFEEEFPTLQEALACTNGEDGGVIALESRPSEGPHEYPYEDEADTYITGMTRTSDGQLKSNFTFKLNDSLSEEN